MRLSPEKMRIHIWRATATLWLHVMIKHNILRFVGNILEILLKPLKYDRFKIEFTLIFMISNMRSIRLTTLPSMQSCLPPPSKAPGLFGDDLVALPFLGIQHQGLTDNTARPQSGHQSCPLLTTEGALLWSLILLSYQI